VPAGYDYARSTEANYCTLTAGNYDDASLQFSGPFADLRATLDYSYHGRWSAERQGVQDAIVQHFLDAASPQAAPTSGTFDGEGCSQNGAGGEGGAGESSSRSAAADATASAEPADAAGGAGGARWLVLTAGAMGAGKTRCMRWLAHHGWFPNVGVLRVDPDLIRCQLPESNGYRARDADSSGTLTQKEAGLIQELLTHAGLAARGRVRCVLVDGSLRHQSWNAALVHRVRREHPDVQVALLHVVAPEATVLLRAQHRARATGRVVPNQLLQKSLLQVPLAVAALAGQVDYAVAIDTSGPEPRLVASASPHGQNHLAAHLAPRAAGGGHGGDDVQTWEAFAARWNQSK
jgi:hypothetical protein